MAFPLQKAGLGHGYQERLKNQIRNRRANDLNVIENPLAHFTDEELDQDVDQFQARFLPSVKRDALLRAARVAKDIRIYDHISRNENPTIEADLPVRLTAEEKKALRQERDSPFSEKGMIKVIATVSLAALLQGFVQSSFNGASLMSTQWGLPDSDGAGIGLHANLTAADWQLGGANGSPWFFAALVGCPAALPINYWFGRRGGIAVAAFLIMASSVGAIFVKDWKQMFSVRVVNGIGMGIKAVSTPILASETAVGFWRGSAILAWQLWVAFGIMMGFVFNFIFTTANSDSATFKLIQGAPLVPALALLVMALMFCPESPRYHLMKGPNYNPERAYQMLRRVRNTELQALRDMYLVHKSIELEAMGNVYPDPEADPQGFRSPGFWWTMADFFRQFRQLFQQRRLYNAVISSSTVNLAQQLCGINVFAFYSGTLFRGQGASIQKAMAYSLGFGAVNFFFALPAIRSIDTLGRRKWLLATLPIMAVFMLGAAMSFEIESTGTKNAILAVFLYSYSPGLGPIPFTLASESFPLSHREAGTAWAISINLGFAGLLSICFPSMLSHMGNGGALGLFSGFNVLAFILIFLLVEETKRRSLEDLDHVFAVSKRRFMSFQAMTVLPWVFRRIVLWQDEPKPEFYRDLIWGREATQEEMTREVDLGEEMTRDAEWREGDEEAVMDMGPKEVQPVELMITQPVPTHHPPATQRPGGWTGAEDDMIEPKSRPIELMDTGRYQRG